MYLSVTEGFSLLISLIRDINNKNIWLFCYIIKWLIISYCLLNTWIKVFNWVKYKLTCYFIINQV